MEIIQRNFFRLLRSGAFADDELLEPMSAFKWRRLYQMVEVQGVADVFLRGVQKHHGEQGLNMPEEILLRAGQDAQKQQSLAELVSRKVGMSMGMLNKRYVKLLDGERHSIDTSVETMDLLRLLVVNEQDFLNHGINMRGIIFLGRYLREKGDRVDFVKLDNWLLRLHLQRMAQLQGSILISVFDFEPDELPFVHREEPAAFKLAVSSVSNLVKDTAQEWHFRQTRTGFVSNNSAVLRRNLRRSFRYLPYATLETVSNFFNNFARSLKEIEE